MWDARLKAMLRNILTFGQEHDHTNTGFASKECAV
jgi:hypothetical protein